MRSTRCDVLLIAADWQSRTLVLAELQEAGYSVTAVPGLRHAYRALIGRRSHPRLILLDPTGDEEATPPYVEQIGDLAPGIPLVLLTGAYNGEEWRSVLDKAAAHLHRPASIGDVVKAVRGLLGRPLGA